MSEDIFNPDNFYLTDLILNILNIEKAAAAIAFKSNCGGKKIGRLKRKWHKLLQRSRPFFSTANNTNNQ